MWMKRSEVDHDKHVLAEFWFSSEVQIYEIIYTDRTHQPAKHDVAIADT